MSDHSKSDSINANSALSGDFNRGQKLAHELAQLSPAGLETAKKIEAIAAERIENERRQQQRSHSYRVLKEKVGLLENYILDRVRHIATDATGRV